MHTFNSCSFNQDKTSTAQCELTQMNEVVVSQEAILRCKLTHRRNDDAVCDRQVLDCKGLEEQRGFISSRESLVHRANVRSRGNRLTDKELLLRGLKYGCGLILDLGLRSVVGTVVDHDRIRSWLNGVGLFMCI